MGLCIIMWAHNGVPPVVKPGVMGAGVEQLEKEYAGLTYYELPNRTSGFSTGPFSTRVCGRHPQPKNA